MRLTLDIAATNRDPRFTSAMLERFAQVEPSSLQVYSLLESPEVPSPIGHCVRLWPQNGELWAEIEIEDGARMPAAHEDPMHAELLMTADGDQSRPIAVVLTSMPRGMLDQAVREGSAAQRRAN